MLKTCVAGLLSLALSSQVPASTTFVSNRFIEKISCDEGSGTGFKVEDGRWVSVAHVAKLTNCTIDNLPIRVTYLDRAGDFAIFDVPGDTRRGGLKVDCRGFVDRSWYFGEGHGGGNPIAQAVPIMFSQLMTDSAADEHGWAVLIYNRVIPGMSGGPVLDELGRVVGTVNALGIYMPISFSKPLKDTPICQS